MRHIGPRFFFISGFPIFDTWSYNRVVFPPRTAPRQGFTLIELVVVIGIIGVLTVLVLPAFTNIKRATDITSTAFTIKGVLEQARNYALINNTYVWVGFFEEDGSIASTNPATAGTGRVVILTVASKDGTIAYAQPVISPATPMDSARLVRTTKLVRLDNLHLRTFPNGSGSGSDTFPTRPPIPGNLPDNAKIGDTSPPDSLRPFQHPIEGPPAPAQYTFSKVIEFSPRGECRVNNNNYTVRPLIEVGFQPVRGTTLDNNKNCAVQLTGFGGNIKIYQP
jgi:prepilin-type N-terminal cleavage/methylation domain-containing protein